jgi:TolB-like protein/tetratricopeptide (TPR) repeat protein
MLSLLQRLKQRKIVQWAIAYAATAWVSLEVFDLIAEQFFWPVWIRQSATILLLFGLFITIVLAWYHGERGRQKIGVVEMVLLVVLLLAGGQSVWLLRDRGLNSEPDVDKPRPAFRAEPLPQNSVAVLPCINLGGDESKAHFADGLAAELITRLSAVSGLRIPSHTSSFSFKGKNTTIEEIAAVLKVRHVLECDVSGDDSRLRASARLIDSQTGYTLWSESYDTTNVQLFDVQQDVAEAVVENLQIKLGVRERQLVRRRWTENPEAYDEFLQGVKAQLIAPTEENIHKMRQHFERAVELDPDFGRGYARLAVTWVFYGNYQLAPASEAYAEVERYAHKAIELDGELYEAYWALGWAGLAGKYAWQAAENNFRKTIELAPGEWAGYHSLGYILGALGRIQEALEAARIAIELDPLAYFPRHGLEVLLTRQRNYAAAIEVFEEQAEIHGWNPDLQSGIAWLMARAGKEAEARVQLAELEAMAPANPSVHLIMAATYAILGEQDRALAIVERWESHAQNTAEHNMAGALAIVYAELGNSERAMHWLTKSRKAHSLWMLFLDDEAFDFLREDARFMALIRELNLPEDVYLSASH